MTMIRSKRSFILRGYTPLAFFLSLSLPAFALRAEPVTFSHAVNQSEAVTPAIKARSLAIEAAQSDLIAADQLPDPKLSVELLEQRIAGPFRFSPRPGRNGFPRQKIGISQYFPNGAKRRARAGQAEADIAVARANKLAEIQDVRLYAALAWIDLYYAKRRLRILDILDQSLKDLSVTVEARLESGSSRAAQAFEPERLIAKLADRRSRRKADIGRGRAMLARWTGIQNPQIDGGPPDITLNPSALMAKIEQLPLIEIQQARVARAEADIDLARANKRPDFAINAAYAHRRPEYGEYVSVGVTIDLPLFAKKRQNPKINARMLDADAARLEVLETKKQLVADLAADLAANKSHRENWERSRDTLLPLAKKQAELDQISYSANRVDLDTALNTAVAFAETEIDLLDREAVLVRDTVRIQFTYVRNFP